MLGWRICFVILAEVSFPFAHQQRHREAATLSSLRAHRGAELEKCVCQVTERETGTSNSTISGDRGPLSGWNCVFTSIIFNFHRDANTIIDIEFASRIC